MSIDSITPLVHIYFVLAILYNVFSQISADLVGRKFAPTDPVYGFQVVSLIYLIFLVRKIVPLWAFVFLFSVSTLSILRFGVGNHLRAYTADSYLSRVTWVAAIGINAFGVLVFSTCIALSIIEGT